MACQVQSQLDDLRTRVDELQSVLAMLLAHLGADDDEDNGRLLESMHARFAGRIKSHKD